MTTQLLFSSLSNCSMIISTQSLGKFPSITKLVRFFNLDREEVDILSRKILHQILREEIFKLLNLWVLNKDM